MSATRTRVIAALVMAPFAIGAILLLPTSWLVMLAALVFLVGLWGWKKGWLFQKRWLLWCFVFSVLGPQIANQAGWAVAELGRQP